MTTRERLLLATREAVRDEGLGRATAREITRRADANLAAIPYHFGTKDALVAEALVADARELVGPILEALAAEAPAADRLARSVALLATLYEQRRADVPTYLTAVATAPHLPPLGEQLAALLGEVRGALAAVLGELRDQGQIPAWVEPEAMAGLVLAVVNGALVGAQADPGGPDPVAIGAQFALLLTGVHT